MATVQAIYANAWVRQSYQQAAGRKVNPTGNLHKRAYAATAVPVRRRHAMKVPERINSAEAVVERKAAPTNAPSKRPAAKPGARQMRLPRIA